MLGQISDEAAMEYEDALASIDARLPGAVASETQADKPWYETALNAFDRISRTLVLSQQQRDLLKINLERARAGQEPLDVSAYTGIGVNVGLSQGTQSLVTYALLGAAAIAIFALMSRR